MAANEIAAMVLRAVATTINSKASDPMDDFTCWLWMNRLDARKLRRAASALEKEGNS